MFKSPIEWWKEFVAEIVQEFANVAFKQLKIFMLKPTTLEHGFLKDAYSWSLPIAISLGTLFFTFGLFKLLFQRAGGYSERSTSEIFMKASTGTVLAIFTPFLLKDVLLRLNNEFVKMILNKGISVSTFAKMVADPTTMGIATGLLAIVLVVLFLVLALQYVIRLGELSMLFVTGPYAAISGMNEDINIWPAWWREAVATVFQQSFQVLGLWISLNYLGDGQSLTDILTGIGVICVLIMGPASLRKILYSTGAGKSMVNAAGGAGKMAIYRLAAKRIVK